MTSAAHRVLARHAVAVDRDAYDFANGATVWP